MDNAPAQNANPGQQLLQLITGYFATQVVGTFARLGVADRLTDGPRPSDDVAREVGAHPGSLYRLMRAAVTVGLVREPSPRSYALTEMGQLLRSDAPVSMRFTAIALSAPGHWLCWGQLPDAIRTGHSPAKAALGTDLWGHYERNPEEGTHFAQAMGALSTMIAMEVSRLHDFSRYARIADVGGSQGVLLEHLLKAYPSCRGILFDLPSVIEGARARIQSVGLSGRVELVGGSFLEPVIPAAEAYLLKFILHDWDDGPSSTILRNVHRSAPAGARLFIMDSVMPDDGTPSPVPLFDLNMLVLLEGRERTAGEFEKLLGGAGWALERITPTQTGTCFIEASKR